MKSVEVPANLAPQTHPAAASAVELQEVTKLFGRFAALRRVSAEFAPGHMYLVVGNNGAGKSTLLRIIAGLACPSYGTLTVLGSARVREVFPLLGYMGHAPLLYDELTALENLNYFAGLYGIRDARASEIAIATVGLDPALKRRVGQYSQGMRQRLSLARAVVHDPQLLLLDEPFSNIDAGSAINMVEVLAAMRNHGKTIFVVTHQPALLEGVADETILMDDGEIVLRTPGSWVRPSPGEGSSGPRGEAPGRAL